MMVHFVHKPATALEVRKWCAMIRNNSEFHLLWDRRADKFREENKNGRKSNGHKQLAR
ncbi:MULTISPECIES: hypothetical protein [Bacillus]|uniref:Uncharacterized protein n=2 Tax=Bacillus subtilis group TaxID=653685 RepID=A0A9Q4E5I8_BACSC|nr:MULTISPECIES: hypothetical protein [Bacillus]MBL3637035.1 hypothetical protein [Alkalicoccobacillus gibsonii]MBV7318182.1 hypothetical protein [Halalkalibacterium halodurans]MCY7761219.1 hypothetical protein [Bacillus spizizenii]KAA0937750.1 hypothetical protein FQ086_09405 [Bacillus sp. ANT_WA51]MBR0020368.1 hypothetical protein [Bacillus subtilis]